MSDSSAWRRRGDLNPGRGCKPLNALAVRSLRPLGHASNEGGRFLPPPTGMIRARPRRRFEGLSTLTRALVIACLAVVLASVPVASPALPQNTVVRTYKGGLHFPVDMVWVKGSKRIFFTEKNSGKVRILHKHRLLRRACVNLDVSAEGEGGALGIELHPRFRRN